MNRRRIVDVIVAIIAGIAIWAYVVSVLDPVSPGTIKSIPVQLVNQEKMVSSGLAIAGTGEYKVDVSVTANRSTLNSLTAEDFIATADISNLTKGQNYITVEVVAPANVAVTEIRTQSIQVYVDDAVDVEKEILLAYENVPDGMELGSIKKSVDSVSVSGAKSLVDAVVDVKAVLDASSMTVDEKVTNSITLSPVNAEGERVYGVKLSQSEVSIDSCLYAVKEVALSVNIVGELNEHVSVRSEIIPSSVSIKGPSSILADIWKIDAAEIDKSSVTESCSIPLNLILPDGIERANASANISVDYELKGRVEKTLTIGPENMTFLGLNEKYVTQKLLSYDMTFSIYEDEVDLFTPESVMLVIDLSEAKLGEGQFAYVFVFDEAMEDVVVVNAPETIDFEIAEATDLT